QCQPTFTCALSNSSHATVVLVAAAVEDNCFDASSLGALCNELANLLGLCGLVGIACAKICFHGRSAGQGDTLRVVYDLYEDVTSRAVDNQAWTNGGTNDVLAQTLMTTTALSGLALALDSDSHDYLPA